jgi:hypothetical protein
VPVALVVVGLLVAAVAVVVAVGSDEGTAAAGEVFLEPAADPGPDAFTDPVDPATPASTAVGATVEPAPAVGVVPTSGVAPAPGSPPYGGTGDDRVCDREQLIAFLTAQPDRAAAWAGVLGVATADVPAYVRGLRPTVLLYDTRVTNHGFASGVATPRQSVLQAGTAVLVDADGDPVVRCRCGNPLRPPAAVPASATVGTAWPGFDPTVMVAVEVGVTVTVEVSGAAPTVPATPTTSTTSGDAPAPGPDGVSDDDRAVAEGLIAVVSECTAFGPVELVDVEPVPDRTGAFTVLLLVGGTEMLFVYEPDTGTITEGDRASADLLAACGVS